MATLRRSKPAAAIAASELQIVEQFGRRLGIKDSAALRVLQTRSRHVIFTKPVGRGRSEVRYEGALDVLLVTRQPLLDTARLLLSLDCRLDAIIARRRFGADADDMRAQLGVAARYTVDESKTNFAKWKPFSQSAVHATDAAKQTAAAEVDQMAESSAVRDCPHANQVEAEAGGPANEPLRS